MMQDYYSKDANTKIIGVIWFPGCEVVQVKLSKRLSAVAAMVPEGSVVADIGTDHGYLPAHLVMSGISPYAIATDVNEGPLAAARNLISLLAIEKRVQLRLGDGLGPLAPNEAETVVMAGIGASTMIKIMEQSPLVLKSVKRLILQPMRGTPKVRTWLVQHRYRVQPSSRSRGLVCDT